MISVMIEDHEKGGSITTMTVIMIVIMMVMIVSLVLSSVGSKGVKADVDLRERWN
jgi:hypothetical protein